MASIRLSVCSVGIVTVTHNDEVEVRRGQRTFRPDSKDDRHTCFCDIASMGVKPWVPWRSLGFEPSEPAIAMSLVSDIFSGVSWSKRLCAPLHFRPASYFWLRGSRKWRATTNKARMSEKTSGRGSDIWREVCDSLQIVRSSRPLTRCATNAACDMLVRHNGQIGNGLMFHWTNPELDHLGSTLTFIADRLASSVIQYRPRHHYVPICTALPYISSFFLAG